MTMTRRPARQVPGGRGWRKTDPQFPGVSEFFPDELAHALNLGRGTAAFRARRARTWRESLPATLDAMRRGRIDERRAGVLADALQHTTPALAQAVEAGLLPEACDLSLAELRRAGPGRCWPSWTPSPWVSGTRRRSGPPTCAPIRPATAWPPWPGHDRRGGGRLPRGDRPARARWPRPTAIRRPIGVIRAAIMTMLILRPADHGLPGGDACSSPSPPTLDGLEGPRRRGGEVNGLRRSPPPSCATAAPASARSG